MESLLRLPIVAVLSALSLALRAVEIDSTWQIVVPKREPSGLSRALADMARDGVLPCGQMREERENGK